MKSTKLFSVRLGTANEHADRTRHFKDGALLPTPSSLEIVQEESEGAFYLYYLDAAGEPQTDTWHLSLDDAFHQAQFEFGVLPADWKAEPS